MENPIGTVPHSRQGPESMTDCILPSVPSRTPSMNGTLYCFAWEFIHNLVEGDSLHEMYRS
ncbi:MAG: hypothetical protein MJZ68_01650 [archaeon]|nr:hypothetical protein [archaeon]